MMGIVVHCLNGHQWKVVPDLERNGYVVHYQLHGAKGKGKGWVKSRRIFDYKHEATSYARHLLRKGTGNERDVCA